METSAPLLGEPLPVELMNTVWADRGGVYDALREPGGAAAWLRAVASRAEPITAAGCGEVDAKRLIALRDALRRLAGEATGDPRTRATPGARDLDAAVAAVNEAAARAPRWEELAWEPGGVPTRRHRTSGSGASALVSAIAAEAVTLFGRGDRRGLRACLAPGCVLYFVKDHPRREWCSAGCGNRARSARHYERRRRTGLVEREPTGAGQEQAGTAPDRRPA